MSHSLFKQNYNKALKGISLESAEVPADVSLEPVTVEDIQLGVDQIDKDLSFINANNVMTTAVAQTAVAAENIPPAVGEPFVSTANCLIADASKVCGGEIPVLKNDLDGAINQISLEELNDWFGVAGEAFAGSSEEFLGRVAGIFSQQSQVLAKMKERLEGAKNMGVNRGSEGGVDINLDQKICQLLVWEGQYSPTPGPHLQVFSEITLALNEVLNDYHRRVLAYISDGEAAVFKGANGTLSSQVANTDLEKRIRDLLEMQEPPLLGNVKYVFSEDMTTPVTSAYLAEVAPDAKALVESLDLPTSLTPEEVDATLTILEVVLDNQQQAISTIVELCGQSFAVIGQTNAAVVDDLSSPTDIINLQSKLVSELGRVCKTQITYQSDLMDRCEAVLVWVAESNIQDF